MALLEHQNNKAIALTAILNKLNNDEKLISVSIFKRTQTYNMIANKRRAQYYQYSFYNFNCQRRRRN